MMKLFKTRRSKLFLVGWMIAIPAIIATCFPAVMQWKGYTGGYAVAALNCMDSIAVMTACHPFRAISNRQSLWLLKVTSPEHPHGKLLAIFNHHPGGKEIFGMRTRVNCDCYPVDLRDCCYLSRDDKLQGFGNETWSPDSVTTSNCLYNIQVI